MTYLVQQLDIRQGEPHYNAAQYVKEHQQNMTLLDFDCWAHLEDILGFEISCEQYHYLSCEVEDDILDLDHNGEDYRHLMALLLERYH